MLIYIIPFATFLSGVVLASAGAVLLARRLGTLRQNEAAATRLRLAAQEAEQIAMRRLRLAAHDLRGVGMSLHGHADQLCASRNPHAGGIATAAADLLDMADDVQDQTVLAGSERVLREEPVELGSVLDEAMRTVAASLEPGRRQWRVTPQAGETVLLADRRALRHALTRVFADAVRNTRQDEWIDVGLEPLGDEVAVVIADEGAGLARPGAARRGGRDSRGIGLRLTLARGLMEAHGGRLEIEASSGVGTRVSLMFPATRVLASREVPV